MEAPVTTIGRLKSLWAARNKRIDQMYEMRRLIDRKKREGYESAVTNMPKVLIRLGRHLLSSSPVSHIIASDIDEARSEKNSQCERALASIWRDIDDDRRATGRRSWRSDLADYMLMTGFFSVVSTVRIVDGQPEFVADIWNPYMTYPEWTDEGLAAVAHTYRLTEDGTRAKAKELEWKLPKDWSPKHKGNRKNPSWATIDLLWEQEGDKAVQSIVVDGLVVQERRGTGMSVIPVLIGGVNGEGVWGGYDGTSANWDQYYGESFLEANYDTITSYNRWMTYQMQLTRDSTFRALLHTGGRPGSIVEEDVKAGRIIDVLPNETIGPMGVLPIPPTVDIIRQELQSQVEQGGFTRAMLNTFGSPPPSGFALSQMQVAAYASLGDFHMAMQYLMSAIDTKWLREFREKGRKAVVLATRQAGVPGLRKEEFSPEVIPEDVVVESSFKLAAPNDRMERLAAARQAHPEGDILDKITILEDVMEVQDAQLVLKRLDDEMAKELPEMRTMRLVASLRRMEKKYTDLGDAELAQTIAMAWKNLLGNLGVPASRAAPGPPGVPGQAAPPELAGRPRQAAAAGPGGAAAGGGLEALMGGLGG